jgi:hypothetical protein
MVADPLHARSEHDTLTCTPEKMKVPFGTRDSYRNFTGKEFWKKIFL